MTSRTMILRRLPPRAALQSAGTPRRSASGLLAPVALCAAAALALGACCAALTRGLDLRCLQSFVTPAFADEAHQPSGWIPGHTPLRVGVRADQPTAAAAPTLAGATPPQRHRQAARARQRAAGKTRQADAHPEMDAWRSPKATPPGSKWDFWSLLPIAPYERRVTLRRELVPGELWSFEQKQGILYVHVPIRMTVYRMTSRRGLFVYAPIAPTDDCVRMLRELEEQHGEVAHIVLPTVAVEHKYFVGPFSREFPRAQVWVCPGQFSVPIQLPLQFLGFPGDRLRVLPTGKEKSQGGEFSMPEDWVREGIDFRVLGPIGKDLVNGAFAETAFYLRRLRTMLVTDLVVSVPTEAPAIIAEDPRALVFHARDGPLAPVEDSEEALVRGWRRISLFALFFQSSAITAQTVDEAVRDAWASKAKDLGWGGLLPWNFVKQWEASFQALRGPLDTGGLFVAPILSELILNRYLSSDVWPFVEDISRSWSDMEYVVPAHFDAPVPCSASGWRDTFRRIFGEPPGPFFGAFLPPVPFFGPSIGPTPLQADYEYLRNTSDFLTAAGVISPPELPRTR